MSGATSRRPDRTPGTGRDREVEVKLDVLDRHAILGLFDADADLAGLGFAADGPVAHRVVADAYLDTPDGRLRAAGLVARTRAERASVRVTVKSLASATPATTHGIHDRLELEGAAGPGLDPAAWPDSPARARPLDVVGRIPLVELGRLRQRRHSLRVRRRSTVVELSLDDLEALDPNSGEVVATTTELEAELLSGERHDLEVLAAGLAQRPGLEPAARSKLDWLLAVLTER